LMRGNPLIPDQFECESLLGTATNKPTDKEWVVDAIIRDPITLRYDVVTIGGLPASVRQRTSHLEKGRPAGGNILFLDSHVAWRKHAAMTNYFGNPRFEF